MSAICIAPLTLGAAPFLSLYWLYQPTVLANPGLDAYKAPPATRLVPAPRPLESLERTDAPIEASLAEVAGPAPQAGLSDERPKSLQRAASSGPIRHSRNLRLGTNIKPSTAAGNVQTEINDPGRRAYRGATSSADAYAFAQGGGSYHLWRNEPSR
jgi:hypothetical protein